MAKDETVSGGPKAEMQEPRGEVAYSQLKDAIQSGELWPGQRIRENDMAKRLEMSR
jgi:DNA-binding GntR family transcriptional regulator